MHSNYDEDRMRRVNIGGSIKLSPINHKLTTSLPTSMAEDIRMTKGAAMIQKEARRLYSVNSFIKQECQKYFDLFRDDCESVNVESINSFCIIACQSMKFITNDTKMLLQSLLESILSYLLSSINSTKYSLNNKVCYAINQYKWMIQLIMICCSLSYSLYLNSYKSNETIIHLHNTYVLTEELFHQIHKTCSTHLISLIISHNFWDLLIFQCDSDSTLYPMNISVEDIVFIMKTSSTNEILQFIDTIQDIYDKILLENKTTLYTKQSCCFISVVLLRLLFSFIASSSPLLVILRITFIIISYLPPEAFQTAQPDYSNILQYCDINMDEDYPVESTVLETLLSLWDMEYRHLIEQPLSHDVGPTDDDVMAQQREKLTADVLSGGFWASMIRLLDKEKEDMTCIEDFLILLHSLLTKFGITNLPRLFVSIRNKGVMFLYQLLHYDHSTLFFHIIHQMIINHTELFSLTTTSILTDSEVKLNSVTINLVLYYLLFFNYSSEKGLQSVLPISSLTSLINTTLRSCSSLYAFSPWPSASPPSVQSNLFILLTTYLHVLPLVSSLHDVISSPYLDDSGEVRWPQYPALVTDRHVNLHGMLWVPLLFPFQRRVEVFHDALPSIQREGDSVEIKVRRSHVVEDTEVLFRSMINSKHQFVQKFFVIFMTDYGKQEEGIDGGGLSREHMTILQKSLFSSSSGLFSVTCQGDLYPAFTDLTCDLQKRYRFVGQVIGRLLLTEQLCVVRFAPFFLNLLLRNSFMFSDLRQIDDNLYKSLSYLQHVQDDASLKDYRMSLDYHNGSEDDIRSIEFIDNGSHITVTSKTVMLYVQYVTQFYLRDRIIQATSCLQLGMSDVLSRADFSLFDALSFQWLLCGKSNGYELADLRAHAILKNSTGDQKYEESFWSVLESFSDNEKSLFLEFITGVGRPPLNGFLYMNPAIEIRLYRGKSENDDEDRLPTSHTCFNSITIPYYRSYETLKKNLLLCIHESEGYGYS